MCVMLKWARRFADIVRRAWCPIRALVFAAVLNGVAAVPPSFLKD